MGSTFGRFFRAATFGESHGPAVGVVIDGMPAGIPLDTADIQRDLDRRRPGTSRFVSPRREPDTAEILSGVRDGKTLGSPIAVLVRNRDAKSKDYGDIANLFRPGHADYTYKAKYGIPPQPGGGRSSGRETVGRTAAGAVAKTLLRVRGITIHACTIRVGSVEAHERDFDYAETNPLRSPDPAVTLKMEELVDEVRAAGDSIGGIVEVTVGRVPPGLGDPVFDKLDAALAGAFMSIGAVKGVEIGAGFSVASMRGSEANDQMNADGFLSNHGGGILGGISTGQTIRAALAVKPTASISLPQSTIDLQGNSRSITISGRHDPCICPRIVPVAEAMAALVLADALLEQTARVAFQQG